MVATGDTVIILTYTHVEEDEARYHTPRLVYVDARHDGCCFTTVIDGCRTRRYGNVTIAWAVVAGVDTSRV
jgi:aspartate 1-decarboxylase